MLTPNVGLVGEGKGEEKRAALRMKMVGRDEWPKVLGRHEHQWCKYFVVAQPNFGSAQRTQIVFVA